MTDLIKNKERFEGAARNFFGLTCLFIFFALFGWRKMLLVIGEPQHNMVWPNQCTSANNVVVLHKVKPIDILTNSLNHCYDST